MRRWSEAEPHERFDAHREPRADHDRVGVDAHVVGQLDRRDVAVGTGDDAAHLSVHDVDTAGSQGIELGVVHVDRVVEHHSEPGAQLAEQRGGVETPRVGDDLDDAPVADLVAVAERTVDDVAAPVLGEAVDVRELVDETGGGQHSSGDQRMATGELDAEAAVVGAGDVDGAAGEDLTAVAADLLTTNGGQLRRRKPLVTEVAVHVGGGGISWLAAVDDDHGPALAPELECGGESGGRSSDDGNVAVALDGEGGVVAHDVDDRVHPERRTNLCDIREAGAPAQGAMAELDEIEQVVRTRLRSLRHTLGLSLEELAARTNLSPSTISRVETGKRTISLDVLLPLAAALQVDLDALLDVRNDDDVVIRPAPNRSSAHDLDAEPTHRQHDRRQDATRTDPRRSRAGASTPVTTGSSSSRDG